MMSSQRTMTIRFGILGGPLQDQLAAQGLRLPGTEVFEKLRTSILMLSLHDYIDEEQKDDLFRRLHSEVGEAVEFLDTEATVQ